VLKRKGNICTDSQEFVRVEAPAYLLDKADSLDDSDACFAGISRFKSDTSVLHPRERNTLRFTEPT